MVKITERKLPKDKNSSLSCAKLLERIYLTRGVIDDSQLDKSLQALHPFTALRDYDKACSRLEIALRQKQRILIIGDFDADGATSTALAMSALKIMGASDVNFLVPNRFEFGYGLTSAIVEVAKRDEPDLIITVDNGIASIEGVLVANAAGIDVLITDHHLPGDLLPDACAIVNPNQLGDLFPSKVIAGVGVIFYVMLALRSHLNNTGWFAEQNIAKPNMAQFLDLVALGTVADVVPLDQNNRIMVYHGILRIRQGRCRPGILALLAISNRERTNLQASDLGFAIAPRLNAAGRLDDMTLGIACLLSENFDEAKILAAQLDELNRERREIEASMKEEAMVAIGQLHNKLDSINLLPAGLCLMEKTWHQGVIGILAGRLKERFNRPVIAFAEVNDNEWKGSARSVENVNIRDLLAVIDQNNPGLIQRFGGHAMAAGLSIYPHVFVDFQKVFIKEVSKILDPSHFEGELLTDGPLNFSELNLTTVKLLQEAGPWGQFFPEPCFDNVFLVLQQRLIKQRHLKLTLRHVDGGEMLNAIAFNVDDSWPNHRATKIRAIYRLDNNNYKGRSSLQLIIEMMHPI